MKKILYLRTDLQELIAGGSVTHTLGVINGFLKLNYQVTCASPSLIIHLKKFPINILCLSIPRIIKFFRWKISCLGSNIFFLIQLQSILKKNNFDFIYQRYSPFNCVGVLLKKIYKIPLTLEYNGSEIWVANHWNPRSFFHLI